MNEWKPLLEIEGKNGYLVRILPYLFDQKRIQLIDTKRPDEMSPGEGQIVRELCTYDPSKAHMVARVLATMENPEEMARTFENATNCESPGRGRIRLDQ